MAATAPVRSETHALRANVSADGLSYLLAVPTSACDGGAAAAAASQPVVVFLHGAGEGGAGSAWALLPGYDSAAQRWCAGAPQPARVTPAGLAVDGSALARGALVLAPRAASRSWEDAATQAAVLRLLDAVLAAHPCADARRVTLTGLSMGGAGAFALGAAAPQRWAGVAPVCGYVQPRQQRAVAAALRDVPVRIYHGTNDVVIPASASQEMADALRDANGTHWALDTFEARAPDGYPSMVGHDSWSQVYGSEAWWAWVRGGDAGGG